MIQIKVILEFDQELLGEKWMNPDNLDLLLYTDAETHRNLFKVVSYEEIPGKDHITEFCCKCQKPWNHLNEDACSNCGNEIPF